MAEDHRAPETCNSPGPGPKVTETQRASGAESVAEHCRMKFPNFANPKLDRRLRLCSLQRRAREYIFLNGNRGSLCVEAFRRDNPPPA